MTERYYYVGLGNEAAHHVPDEDAVDYALERCKDDLRYEFEEWFYSGNWLRKKGELPDPDWS